MAAAVVAARQRPIELLAPALDADIERPCTQAHRFNARIVVTLDTILRDDALAPTRRLVWQHQEAGADALIVQDMGLLLQGLPRALPVQPPAPYPGHSLSHLAHVDNHAARGQRRASPA